MPVFFVFTALGLTLSLWVFNSTRASLSEICEAHAFALRGSVEGFLTQTESLYRNTLKDNLPPPLNDQILATAVYKQVGPKWELMVTDFHPKRWSQLGLTPHDLSVFGSVTLSEVKNGARSTVHPIRIQNNLLWNFEFMFPVSGEIYAVSSILNPEYILRNTAQATDCALVAQSSLGEVLVSSLPLEDLEKSTVEALWGRLSSPLSQGQTLQLSADDTTDIRIASSNYGISFGSIIRSSSAQSLAINWFLLTLILGAGIGVLSLLASLPRWYQDLHQAEGLERSLRSYLAGKFDDRPRLFLTNHFAGVEAAVDLLGGLLPDWLELGGSWKKLRENVTRLKHMREHPEAYTLSVLTVALPPLSAFSDTDTDTLSFFTHISEKFHEIVKRNLGIVDVAHPDKLVAFWGYPGSQELDPANATMTALELRIFFEELNIHHHLKSIFQPGMSIVRGQVIIASPGQGHDLELFGDLVFEGLTASRYSLQSKQDVLVSQGVLDHISNYFILTPSHENAHVGLREKYFRVMGYVDSNENPVLIRSRLSS